MDVWRKDAIASGLKDRKVILICEGKAHEFTSQDGKKHTTHSISSSKAKLWCQFLPGQISIELFCCVWFIIRDIRINTLDIDIFFIGFHFDVEFTGVNLQFNTRTGNKERLISITNVAAN